ncbi:hypothetical protein EYS14_22975 [Alteromonadaceae bacterium M269]|nr:hypothetical protein EYS14_22975 [Alteromonadaceae bacterium M269]
MARKTWQQKFDDPKPSEVKIASKDFADIKAGQKMLLTTPKDVDAYIRAIPKGQSLSIKELRAELAKGAGAEIACPVVTGIHLRTVAEIVTMKLDTGVPADELTPVWRVIEPKAPVIKKLEYGATKLMELRKAEGLSFA